MFYPSILGGRGRTGSDSSGVIWHAVEGRNGEAPDYGIRAALCGAEPGRRSLGWSSYRPAGQTVTCPKCLKKLAAAEEKS